MPIVKLDTGYNIEVEFAVAPFYKRLLAWILDLAIIWLIVKVLSSITGAESFFVWSFSGDYKTVLITLPVLFYHLLFELLMNGRSPGKLAMKCKVITEEGGQPGTGQYLIRWIFRLIDFPVWLVAATFTGIMPWWTFPLLFSGLASVLITSKSQRLGDLIAGTILIDTRNSTSWQDTIFTELSEHYKPKYPQVMQLSDRDVNTLKTIIDTVRKNNDQEMARKIADRIKSKIAIESDEYPSDFLETLLTDYNYYSTR